MFLTDRKRKKILEQYFEKLDLKLNKYNLSFDDVFVNKKAIFAIKKMDSREIYGQNWFVYEKINFYAIISNYLIELHGAYALVECYNKNTFNTVSIGDRSYEIDFNFLTKFIKSGNFNVYDLKKMKEFLITIDYMIIIFEDGSRKDIYAPSKEVKEYFYSNYSSKELGNSRRKERQKKKKPTNLKEYLIYKRGFNFETESEFDFRAKLDNGKTYLFKIFDNEMLVLNSAVLYSTIDSIDSKIEDYIFPIDYLFFIKTEKRGVETTLGPIKKKESKLGIAIHESIWGTAATINELNKQNQTSTFTHYVDDIVAYFNPRIGFEKAELSPLSIKDFKKFIADYSYEKYLKSGGKDKENSSKRSNDENEDIPVKLKKLKNLYESDLITEEEYNKKKQELLDKM